MLTVENVSIRYEEREIVKEFSFHVEQGEIVSIIGPNGSGKSTLLKSIARMHPYIQGQIIFNKVNMKKLSTKDIARKLCMLSQRNETPSDMTVGSLVSYGRYPHKKWFKRLNEEDQQIIDWALEKTKMLHYKEKLVGALSGGEAQRAWIAMALAQKPQLLLLDEPTTYLDIAHQHEILELVRELNQETGMTVIMVLHDLNQAATYSDKIIVIKEGCRNCMGIPNEVMTPAMIREVYKMESEVNCMYANNIPRIHLLCATK